MELRMHRTRRGLLLCLALGVATPGLRAETVRVKVEEAKILIEKEVVGLVRRGQRLTVVTRRDPWIWVHWQPEDGEKRRGWIKASAVELVKEEAAETPAREVSAPSGWPWWRGPDRNGISREKGVLRTFPPDGPRVLWRAQLGTGFSGISVAGNRVFTMYGENGREVAAGFDAASGKLLWKVDSDSDFGNKRGGGPRATPAVAGGLVYTVGASGRLMCLEAGSGRKVWAIHLRDDLGAKISGEGLSPSPLVEGEAVIVLAGARDASVVAFDKRSGKVLWKALSDKINHSSPTVVEMAGRRHLVVLSASNAVGLSLDDGRELWRHPMRAVNIATPVWGHGNQLFLAAAYGYGCQLLQLAADDGGISVRQVYKNSVMANHHCTSVLYDGHLYGFHDRAGSFKCVKFDTGEEVWESRQSGKGKLIVADGQLIVLDEGGRLFVAPASPDGFEPTASARVLRGICYTAPSLADGRLYVRNEKEMVCLDLR